MKKFIGIIMLCCVVAITSCNMSTLKGNGNIIREERITEAFTKIVADGSMEIVLSQGSKESISVMTDENLLKNIESIISGKVLSITQKGNLAPTKTMVVYITVIDVSAIATSGSVKISGATPLHVQSLKLEGSGAVECQLEVYSDVFDASMDGSSELILTGKASKAEYHISGSGKLMALDYETSFCKLEVAGSAEAKVNVTTTLDVDISGSSEVKYKGAATVNQQISGSGRVSKL